VPRWPRCRAASAATSSARARCQPGQAQGGNDPRHVDAHVAAGQQQQRHQPQRPLRPWRRRIGLSQGPQRHRRAPPPLQLRRQLPQLRRQLASGTAVHHQQQGVGQGKGALRHLAMIGAAGRP
jgi:hypothetical protein